MELFEQIVEIVNEELGISNVVKSTTDSIMSAILKDKKGKPLFKNKRSGVIKRFKLFNKVINIEYDIYFVNDKSEIDQLGIQIAGYYNDEKKTLKTTLIYIKNENKYLDFDGTLQHEVEHAYQTYKSGKPLISPKNVTVYAKANSMTNSSDDLVRVVGYTLYYANKFEIDGKINGLYKHILDNWSKPPIEVVKETTLYHNLSTIKYFATANDDKIKNKIDYICQAWFGRHYNWWKNIAMKMVSAYMSKIGKVVAKVEKDNAGNLIDDQRLIIPPQKIKE